MNSFCDWIDYDLRTLDQKQIEADLAAKGQHGYLIRDDKFDKYPDGKVIQRVYVTRKP